jgi:hypothetical protein
MSEYPRTEISPLLENIVNDNPTYDFPVQSIREELVQLFMHQEEYHYFIQQSYRILNRDHHEVFANVFITTLELMLDTQNVDPYTLPQNEYHSKIDTFIEVLENLKVTRIEKNSPDGELMSAML